MSVRILQGDCRELLAGMEAESVDSCVCDPPYHLTSIVKRFGSPNAAPVKLRKMPGQSGSPYARAAKGFMGQTWDGGDVAFDPATWEAVWRVLKPGAHLVAFSGTRTYHRMVCAIEDAGFEIRDQLAWVYGAGFPKSHNMSHRRGKEFCGCDSETESPSERDLRLVRDADVSTALATSATGGEILFEGLPQQSPPRAMLRAEPSQGSTDAPQPGMEGRRLPEADARQLPGREVSASAGVGSADGEGGRLHHAASASDGTNVRLPADAHGGGQSQGSQSGEQRPAESGIVADERGPQAWGGWPLCPRCGKPDIPDGLGTALKPAWEPICLARKPLIGTVAANILQYGTGAINVDGCRIGFAGADDAASAAPGGKATGRPLSRLAGTEDARAAFTPSDNSAGRWPANILHDGSEEVLAGFPDVHGAGAARDAIREATSAGIFGLAGGDGHRFGDSGSAARFFYCAKATSAERGEGNGHPTVKPVALMQWLVRLVTPKGGTVLDPFAGSGSTLIAADLGQFNAIGCELSPEYAAIAERRVRTAAGLFGQVEAA